MTTAGLLSVCGDFLPLVQEGSSVLKPLEVPGNEPLVQMVLRFANPLLVIT